jgi:N-acetylmuramoyl-L-alanine amidase
MYTPLRGAVNTSKWRRFLKSCRLAAMRVRRSGRVPALVLLLAACGAPRPSTIAAPAAPPVGPLTVRVVYPPLAADSAGMLTGAFASGDSAFVFGSVSRSDADVLVNGEPVPVAPTGAWIAWVGLPDDTVAGFRVRAQADTLRAELTFSARLPRPFRAPDAGLWIDTTALSPAGRLWLAPGEGLRLGARASPGAALRLVVSDSVAIPLVPDGRHPAAPWGELAFGTVAPMPRGEATDRYAGWLTIPVGPHPGPVLAPAGGSAGAHPILEAVLGADTLRVAWPLSVAVLPRDRRPVAVVNDDTAGTGDTDGMLAGRPAPYGTYHWFLPNGTRAVVSGRREQQVRLQLSERTVAWVDAVDLHALPPGTPPPSGVSEAMRLRAGGASVTLRVPLPGPVPFRVDEDGRRLVVTVYGVAANADWIQYGPADPLVDRIAFDAPAADEMRVLVDLTGPVWGYRTWWAGDALLLEIRRPPRIDPRHPLRGIRVALDPGHPPAGATGPTGAYEGDVNLAVARAAVPLFERAGAEVLLVRDDSLPLGLAARTRAAEDGGADLLISIHNNALPDGVNPFANSGTSTYYFHPRAVGFAREVNRAMVRRFGFRDLGIGRGDLAMVRPTWMPAILTEGLFMMLPDQEAVLVSAAGQRAYAEALVEGAAAFLAAWARTP